MTIKQAAMWLCQPGIVSMIHDPTTKKALSVAVKALTESEHGTNLAEVGTDCISREQAIETFKDCAVNGVGIDGIVDALEQLPPIQPKLLQPWEVLVAQSVLSQPDIVRCKDCKHWKDSDGVFRRGTGAESKCPLNLHQVYEGTFFCGLAERREVTE